jgi:hypothetical protein
MFDLLDKIPYLMLIVIAIVMFALPFPMQPMPHVIEKIIMLKNGELKKLIDIFDLFMHLTPTIILVIKIIGDLVRRNSVS